MTSQRPKRAPRTTLAEIAEATGVARRAVTARAKRNQWPYAEEHSSGRHPRRVYRLDQLPPAIAAAVREYRARSEAVGFGDTDAGRAHSRARKQFIRAAQQAAVELPAGWAVRSRPMTHTSMLARLLRLILRVVPAALARLQGSWRDGRHRETVAKSAQPELPLFEPEEAAP